MTILIFIRNILQLLLAPAKGWEDVSGTMSTPSWLLTRYFYPLIALAGVSEFVRMLYDSGLAFSTALISCFVVCVSLFVTYFFALVVFRTYFDNVCEGAANERKYTTVIIYCLCLLSIFTVVCNVINIKLLQYLLPLVVCMVFWKSNVYLRVRSDRDLVFLLMGFACIVLPPGLIQWMFA